MGKGGILNAEGYRVIRYVNDDVFKNIEGVLTDIIILLADRPTPGPSRKREGRDNG